MGNIKFLGKFSTLFLAVGFVFSGLTVPASAAPVLQSQVVTGFKGTTKSLSSSQKSKLSAAMKKYPESEKISCVGLVYKNRNASVARARAKAACDYLKKINPGPVFFVTSAKTTLANEAGQIEIQYRWTEISGPFVETDAIDFAINPNYKVGKKCGGGFGWQVVGLDEKNNPAFLKCSNPNGGVFKIDAAMPKIDPKTKKPLIPEKLPNKSIFGYSPNLYIEPNIVETAPKTALTNGAFNEYAKCKIAEVGDGSPDKSFGFPLPAKREKLKQGFRILVVPVQFTDHQTKNKPANDLADVVSMLTNFYTRASSVPISFDWTIPNSYYKMGKSIDSFELNDWSQTSNGSFYDKYEPYLEAALALADADYDFNDFDVVIVEEPRSVTNREHPMYIPHAQENGGRQVDTNDGPVRSILVTGNDELRDIPNWIHEFGHLLGLPDRNSLNDTKPGFDIMWGWYGSPELSVWSRWQLEILKDQQVDCKTDTAKSTHLVQPVAWVGDYKKGVVIPVSDHEAIVVESRRRQGYDVLFGKESEGAYVYRIDTSALIYKKDTKNPVDVIAPARSKAVNGSWALDASLKLGESVTSDGWTIKVVEAGAFGDVVEVSKG